MDHKTFLNKVNAVLSKLVFDNSKIQGVHNEPLSKDNRDSVWKFFEDIFKQENDALKGEYLILN